MEKTKDSDKKSDITTDKQSMRFLCPPFRYYLVSSFLISIFLVIIDGIYRSEAFLIKLPFLMALENGLFLWMPVFCAILLASLLLWGMDALHWLKLRKKNTSDEAGKIQYTNYISGTLYYIFFAYINVIYFRLYVSSFVPGMRKNGIIVGAVCLSCVAVVIAVLMYFFRYRKYIYSRIFSGLINPLYKPSVVLTILLFAAGIIAFNFSGNSGQAHAGKSTVSGEKPHIILITMDNVRAANMTLYGYKRPTTPFLDHFAKESTVFENLMSNSSETMTTMPCIVTGKSPSKKFPNAPSFYDKSLPTVLAENGYAKTVFLSPLSMNMFPRKLFSEYMIFNNSSGDPIKRFSYLGKSRKSLIWLSYFLSEDERFFNVFHLRDPRDLAFRRTKTIMTEGYEHIVNTMKNSSKPVFVWAHYLETHPPYNPPPVLREYFKGSRDPELDKYDACIKYSDYELGNFIGRLKSEGLYDNTLIVISSDHGCYFPRETDPSSVVIGAPPQESLRFTHLMVNVPLIIHRPHQKSGKRTPVIATHADIAPTVLEIAGIEIPAEMNGESLVKFMDNENLMSKKVKVSLPAHYLYRWNRMAFEDTLGIQFEFFNAGYDRFVVELAQRQFDREGGKEEGKKIITSQLPWTIVGVYDITTDRNRKNNLKNDPGVKQVVDEVMSSDKINYYGTVNPEDTN